MATDFFAENLVSLGVLNQLLKRFGKSVNKRGDKNPQFTPSTGTTG